MWKSLALIALAFIVAAHAHAQTHTARSFELGAPAAVVCDRPAIIASLEATDTQLWQERYRALNEGVRDHHRPTSIEALPPGAVISGLDLLAATRPVETAVAAADSGALIIDQMPVATSRGKSSTIGEPSVAVRGDDVLFTGNWYAALSKDGGGSFAHLNPRVIFPLSPNDQRFCCDQVTIAHGDTIIWLLQYSRTKVASPESVPNILRVAFANGGDVQKGCWRYYDLSPPVVGGWLEEWFDFPDLVAGDNHLYITTNAFDTKCVPPPTKEKPQCHTPYRRSTLIRLPLAEMKSGKALTGHYFGLEQNPEQTGTLRATQGARHTIYWGTHKTQGAKRIIRVYAWPESGLSITSFDVEVDAWRRSVPVAPHKNGRDWIGRADQRITTAWLHNDIAGFAWTAPQDDTYVYPQVRVALVDVSTKKVIAQPHLWNRGFAYAYPAAAPNGQGEVGFSLFHGGKEVPPSHAVAILARKGPSDHWSWRVQRVVEKTETPDEKSENRWGDYLAVRAHPSGDGSWVATGYNLIGGSTPAHVQAEYIRFSSKDQKVIAIVAQQDPLQGALQSTQRVVGIWRQQPDNLVALQSALANLRMNLQEVLRSASSETRQQDTSDRDTLLLLDTYRHAGVSDKLAAELATGSGRPRLVMLDDKARSLETLLRRVPRDEHAEALLIQDLERLITSD